jgi:glycerol-3-phosphate acyltransferase PlsY
MRWIIIGIISSYLLGSIPTAYIFGRILKGIDIRKFGSGNVGATNALRVLGKGPGITVLLLDMLKGVVAVVFLGDILAIRILNFPDETLRIVLGLACICGHNWTLFLRFKGGKGVATTLGVLLGLALKIPALKIVFGLVILTWLISFLLARIVSVASLIAGVSLPFFTLIFRQSLTTVFSSTLICLLIILRHKSNLKRIFSGQEPRLSFKKKKL